MSMLFNLITKSILISFTKLWTKPHRFLKPMRLEEVTTKCRHLNIAFLHPKWAGGMLLALLFLTIDINAQEEKETLEKERVEIIKAYTPTISDAFKIRSTPTLEDSVTQKKKEVRYSIFSVPVASTYTPQKGRAENLDKPKPIPLYDNYATLGFGNYTSVLAEFYSNFQINRRDNAGVYLHHNSSQGGIDEVRLDDKYYNTFLDLTYTSRTKDFVYGFEVGAEHQLFNWYGLPDIPELTQEELNSIDPEQAYFGAKLGGKFEFEDLLFKKVAVQYRYFGDAYSSRESHFVVTPTVEFEVADELLTTHVTVDFVKGNFEKELIAGIPNDYQILNMGVQPNLLILRDNLSLSLGAEAVYSVDNQREDSKLFLFPQVTASYRLLKESVIAYGGLEGGLQQNTYRNAVQQNPYVSPDLQITPTSTNYDAYVGFKGKISDLINYNIRGSYISEGDKALFANNRIPELAFELLKDYEHGNSFSYRYDDVTTTIGYGELNFTLHKNFKLGITGEYFSYETDQEAEAWNLPELKASVFADYQINEQWFAGAQVFYVGERKDIDNAVIFSPPNPEATQTLDSFLDANINIGYRFNEQLSVFLKGNNLAGNMYERWVNFPVQGIQVLGGVTYKFNW